MGDYKIETTHFVNLQISTSKNDVSFAEKRFPKDITIADLKAKLELMTGGNCGTMVLEIYDKNDKLICQLLDNDKLLGSYPVNCGMRLHIVDKFLLRNEFDTENVEKFELSQEEYSKKSNSVRAFLQRNKMGQYNEEFMKKKEQAEEEEKELIQTMSINSRCKVNIPNTSARLGTIRYLGEVENLKGYWVGVQYDEPLGKHNGTFKEKQYFVCPDKYGAFVKPQVIMIGDFPEELYDLDDEI